MRDEPADSSAARCMRFHVQDASFGPEYTHQAFPGEVIRGYRPKALSDEDKAEIQHSSYALHEQALHELEIEVTLSPSCRYCALKVMTKPRAPKRPLLDRPTRPAQRSKVEDVEAEEIDLEGLEEEDEEDLLEEEEEEEFSLFEYEAETASEEEPQEEGSTRKRRMPLKEIRDKMTTFLPEVMDENVSILGDYLRRPPGRVVQTVEVKGQTFVLSLADGKDATSYHEHVQKLAIFFIETADNVDVASVKDGYWKVLYIFRQRAHRQYALAGYFTLFHFQSPFRKPTPGVIVRICQALLLPPYQRLGLGRLAFHAVYEHSDVVEVNVEDPAPGFVQLRNYVDFERCLVKKGLEQVDPTSWDAPPDAVNRADALKMMVRQYLIATEIFKLSHLLESGDDLKPFRLMVKKRLNKEHREELSTYKSKEEMKEVLASLYDRTEAGYRSILKRVKNNS